jgi:hypothetical protein
MQISSAAIELAKLANGGDDLTVGGTRLNILSPEGAQNILDMTKVAMANPANDEMAKSVTLATGVTAYNLRAPSLLFSPTITPLRNSLKRTQLPNPGNAANWKAINSLNYAPQFTAWVPEGRRSASITYSAAPASATYATMGVEDDLTDEARFAAQGFEDEEALVQMRSLYKLMQIEEASLLHGNASLQLGVCPTPTAAASGSGATLPAATYSVICVALTALGMLQATLAGGVITTSSVTSNDGQGAFTLNGGCSNKSAAASQAITLGQVLSASVAPVNGAAGYAWYVGTAGSETLQAITSINSATFSAPLAGSRQAATAIAADYSANSIGYDGLLTQAYKNNTVAYVATLATGTAGAGTQMTSVGDGEVKEIRDMLKAMWDNYRVSVTKIFVHSQELTSLTKLVLTSGSGPLLRINTQPMQSGPTDVRITAGAVVGWYFNPYGADGGRYIPIIIHPNMVPGTIFGYAENLPATYMSNETPTVAELLLRQDYYVEKWPRTSRKTYFGTYCQSVPAVYAPFCLGVITNIAPTT